MSFNNKEPVYPSCPWFYKGDYVLILVDDHPVVERSETDYAYLYLKAMSSRAQNPFLKCYVTTRGNLWFMSEYDYQTFRLNWFAVPEGRIPPEVRMATVIA